MALQITFKAGSETEAQVPAPREVGITADPVYGITLSYGFGPVSLRSMEEVVNLIDALTEIVTDRGKLGLTEIVPDHGSPAFMAAETARRAARKAKKAAQIK